jgi:hypothetical protein
MSERTRPMLHEVFIAPGAAHVSAAALQYAREFAGTVGASPPGRYVTTFDWAQSLGMRQSAGAPLENIGPCLSLSADERADVPAGLIQTSGDFEFAVRMPLKFWKRAASG